MTNGELVELFMKHAKKYCKDNIVESISRNGHMNDYDGSNISQPNAEAIVVDFVNFMALQHGIDLAMYTSNLNE